MSLFYAQQFITKTLVGAIDDATTSITIGNSTGLDATVPGLICISWADPLDTSVVEYVSYTSITANVLQGVTRGAEGYAAKSHLNGAVIAWPISESHINNINDKLRGVDAVLAGDPHGNEVIKTDHAASAVNEITVTNAATTNNPIIGATGEAGVVLKFGTNTYKAPVAYSPASGTQNLDLSLTNNFIVTLPATNAITFTVSNAETGMFFKLSINNVTSQASPVFFTTIRWAGGITGTVCGTNGKRDTFTFEVTGAVTYDGFIVGTSI